MKSEIPVFMVMKRVHGFFNTFSWDFHEKEIRSVPSFTKWPQSWNYFVY